MLSTALLAAGTTITRLSKCSPASSLLCPFLVSPPPFQVRAARVWSPQTKKSPDIHPSTGVEAHVAADDRWGCTRRRQKRGKVRCRFCIFLVQRLDCVVDHTMPHAFALFFCCSLCLQPHLREHAHVVACIGVSLVFFSCWFLFAFHYVRGQHSKKS